MQRRRRRINPTEDAQFYVSAGRDKVGLVMKFINALKGTFDFLNVHQGSTFKYSATLMLVT